MKPKNFNVLFLIAIVITALAVLTKSPVLFFCYFGIILFYSFIDFRLTLVSWFVIMPFTRLVEDVYLSFLYGGCLLIAYVFQVLKGKRNFKKNSLNFALVSLLCVAIISSFISGYTEYIHTIFLYVIIFGLVNIIVQEIYRNNENIILISNSLIIAALIATVSSFFGGEDLKRITIGDNVRAMANTVSVGLILLFLFYRKKITVHDIVIKSQYRILKRVKWFVVLFLLIGLISTVSRGAIISVLATIALVYILSILKDLKQLKINKILRLIFVGALFLMTILSFSNRLVQFFGIDMDFIMFRFSSEKMEGGTGIRQRIWEAGVEGLSELEYIYGYGLSSFQFLARQNGYDFYSHSVYIDIFVTAGALGIIILALVYFGILKRMLKYKDILGFALLFFLTFLFITHGSMRSGDYWYLLALCYAWSKNPITEMN